MNEGPFAFATGPPKAIYVWFKDSFTDAERFKVRRIIRYLKAWAALKFPDLKKRPSSILLTVLAAEAAMSIGAAKLGDDDDALADVVEVIVARIEASNKVKNPVNKDEDMGGRYDSEQWQGIETAFDELSDICERAIKKDTELAAADVWQEAFEHMFPLPGTEKVTKALAEDARLPPTLVFMPEVSVRSVSDDNPNLTFSGMNQIGPIPRNCSITFELFNASGLPPYAEVSWIVRNEGREAELKNDLGHVNANGLSVVEHSEYKGRHYMDCTVKQYGTTIALRRIPVTIQASEAPRRNPAAKPAWTKFRR